MKPDYNEFNDPRLAPLYDVLWPTGADKNFFLSEIASLAPESIIDLGCGTGALTCELAKSGYRMTGVEPAEPMLAIARKRSCNDEVTWFQGSAEKLLRFSADLVIMTAHVAQFFVDDAAWENALQAMHQALIPGGHVLFDSKNPLIKPWEKYSKSATDRIHDKSTGRFRTWIETVNVAGNRATHAIHYVFEDTSEELISTNELAFRPKDELRDSLGRAGFAVERAYGDWDRSEWTAESPETIVVAKRR